MIIIQHGQSPVFVIECVMASKSTMDFCRHVVYVKQNIPTLFLSAKIQLVLLSGAVYYIYLDFLSLGHCVKISIVFPR